MGRIHIHKEKFLNLSIQIKGWYYDWSYCKLCKVVYVSDIGRGSSPRIEEQTMKNFSKPLKWKFPKLKKVKKIKRDRS